MLEILQFQGYSEGYGENNLAIQTKFTLDGPEGGHLKELFKLTETEVQADHMIPPIEEVVPHIHVRKQRQATASNPNPKACSIPELQAFIKEELAHDMDSFPWESRATAGFIFYLFIFR